jgi:hypothetical protein
MESITDLTKVQIVPDAVESQHTPKERLKGSSAFPELPLTRKLMGKGNLRLTKTLPLND